MLLILLIMIRRGRKKKDKAIFVQKYIPYPVYSTNCNSFLKTLHLFKRETSSKTLKQSLPFRAPENTDCSMCNIITLLLLLCSQTFWFFHLSEVVHQSSNRTNCDVKLTFIVCCSTI